MQNKYEYIGAKFYSENYCNIYTIYALCLSEKFYRGHTNKSTPLNSMSKMLNLKITSSKSYDTILYNKL